MQLTQQHLDLARRAGACDGRRTRYRAGQSLSEVASSDLQWIESRLPEEAARLAAIATVDCLAVSRGAPPLFALGSGDGYGYGSGYGDGYGDGYGSGYGYGYGDGYGSGYGYGDGYGYGYGYGSGYGSGYGDGSGYGYGDGSGYGYGDGETARDVVLAA